MEGQNVNHQQVATPITPPVQAVVSPQKKSPRFLWIIAGIIVLIVGIVTGILLR